MANFLYLSSGEIFRESRAYSKDLDSSIPKLVSSQNTITKDNSIDLRMIYERASSVMPSRNAIIKNLDNGRIKIVFDTSNPLGKMVSYVPYEASGQMAVVINANTYFNRKEIPTSDGVRLEYSIIGGSLATLMEILNMAYVVLEVSSYSMKTYSNSHLKKTLLTLYAEMFMSVASRKTSIASTDMISHLIYYIFNFVQGVMFDMKNFDEYSLLSQTLSGLSAEDKLINDNRMPIDTYTNFSEFINALKERFVSFKDVTVSLFINGYHNLYGAVSIYSLDYLPYLCALLASGVTNSITLHGTFKKNFNNITKLGGMEMITNYRGV